MARNTPKRAGSRNPRNPESPLFQALTRLLSGPITNFRKQDPRQLKRWQLDKHKFRSVGGLSFKRSSYSPFSNIYAKTRANAARGERYLDFDQMEFNPILSTALDIYADEMTTSTPMEPLLKIESPNDEIKEVLNHLFYTILDIEYNANGWARSMSKYGDLFLYLEIDEEQGITNFLGLPPQEVERLEGEDETNPDYVQFQWNSGGLTFENWQVAHFRILGNDKWAPYGTSVLDPVRRIWRQLDLLENAMMAYRIVRSPERRVWKVDVGGIPDNEIEQYVQDFITTQKKEVVVDPDSGDADIRYDPYSVEEDYYIPVRGDKSATSVDTLQGGQYTGDVDDVKYLLNKLVSGLKIPHAYLLMQEGDSEDKTTLAQKDIRFARTIQRLQRYFTSELRKIAIIHLGVLGYTGKDLLNFKISLNNPSKLAELQDLEHWRTKFDVAGAANEGFFSRRWIANKILGMSDEEFLRNIREMHFDRQLDAKLESLATPPEEGEGGLGDLGGDLGGDDDLGLGDEEGGGEEGDDILLAEPPEGGEEPGKRFSRGYVTPGSKGKVYKPVTTDKRGMGARQRSMLGQGAIEVSKNTPRNVWKGRSELASLARGVFEEYQTNYKEQINKEKTLKKNPKEEKIILEEIRQTNEFISNIKEDLENKEVSKVWKKNGKKTQ